MYKNLILFFVSTLLFSCNKNKNDNIVDGYAPIYSVSNADLEIKTTGVQNYTNAGRIVVYGTYVFQIDKTKGIHVIDISSTVLPKKINFISVPGIIDFSIKDNIIIANNYKDLVTINIANINSIVLANRINDAFKSNIEMPLESNAFFECVDSTKGMVIGWQFKSLTNPRCKTN